MVDGFSNSMKVGNPISRRGELTVKNLETWLIRDGLYDGNYYFSIFLFFALGVGKGFHSMVDF